MMNKLDKVPMLFSICTKLAYNINTEYYKDIHYVWCAESFDSPKQAPTSDPCKIARRYLEVISGDKHSAEIINNKAGILRGAMSKYKLGEIDEKQHKEIRNRVAAATYRDFFPVAYIIPMPSDINRCEIVAMEDRARDTCIEYIISDLKGSEFELLDFELMLMGLVNVSNKKAGK